MRITTKDQAIKAIQNHQASQVLATLLKWRVADPQDKGASYLYAWALEKAGYPEKATEVWNSCTESTSDSDSSADSTIEASPIKYTYELASKLLSVWADEGGDDPIDQMIAHLNAAPGSESEEVDPSLAQDLVDLDDDSTIVSATFGRILIAQQKYADAAIVYRRLAEVSPDQRDFYLAEASRLTTLAQAESGP